MISFTSIFILAKQLNIKKSAEALVKSLKQNNQKKKPLDKN